MPIVVTIDAGAIKQSADMCYRSYLHSRAHAQHITSSFNKTVVLIKSAPKTTGFLATKSERRKLGISAKTPLRVCADFAPVRALYKMELNGSHTEVTILTFE